MPGTRTPMVKVWATSIKWYNLKIREASKCIKQLVDREGGREGGRAWFRNSHVLKDTCSPSHRCACWVTADHAGSLQLTHPAGWTHTVLGLESLSLTGGSAATRWGGAAHCKHMQETWRTLSVFLKIKIFYKENPYYGKRIQGPLWHTEAAAAAWYRAWKE